VQFVYKNNLILICGLTLKHRMIYLIIRYMQIFSKICKRRIFLLL